MVKVILIEKNATVKETKILKFDKENIYKKCKLKNNDNFEKRTTWKMNDNTNVTLFSRDEGRASSENKFELPPPVDNNLFFGCMILCAHSDDDLTNDNVKDLNLSDWKKLYEKLMGGPGEDLGDEDSERSEDEEDIDLDDLDENGYLKDSFLVDDKEEIEIGGNSDEENEYSGDETESDGDFPSDENENNDDDSELDEENYNYDD